MKNILSVILLALVLILASACRPASAPPTSVPPNTAPVQNTTAGEAAAYPSPVAPGESYPAPTGENPAYPAPSAAQGPYPYPAPAIEGTAVDPGPYPAPEGGPTVLATPGAVPQAAPDSSVIVGRLTLKGKPVVNATIYLADIRKDETGQYQVAAYSRSSSPRASTDSDGQFVFANIPPGDYSLILDNFTTYMVLNIPGAGAEEALKIKTEAGKVTDLGTLDYEELPAL